MKNIIANKFWWAARSFAAVAVLGVSVSNLSADTLTVTWTGAVDELRLAIINDNYEHDVYLLEADKVYLQQETIELESSCHIVGAPYGDGEHPATIQPYPLADGQSGFSGWPQTNFKTHGEDQSYEFKNLLFNGMFADGSQSLFGVLSTYGERNSILVDHVTSVHNQVITYFNFGHEEHWTLTNNTAVQYTSYQGGMWFGGFFWGGGGWSGGSLESLFIQNNTIEGTHGQPLVIWDNGLVNRDGGEMIHIDHNTFVNSTLEASWGRGGNNTHWTNNLFVNMQSGGQTRNSGETNLALNIDRENGHGKIMVLYQQDCNDSTLIADGNCYDKFNRNIHYNNNAWFDTPELLEMFNNDPWCWNLSGIDGSDSLDFDGNVVSLCDTMIAGQSKWIGDSTTAQFVNNVSETNNINAANLGWNLDTAYIANQIRRTEDFLENGQGHEIYYDANWLHQADDDLINVQWPLPMDFSYSETSTAATHCTHGGPLGSTHHMDHEGTLIDPNLDDRVFISEVAEGTSNNKYIEIYNGTGEDVDLGAYSLSSCNNGCDNEEFDYPDNVTFESGTIVAPGDVYVVCHGSASDGIQAECDQHFTYLSNGDDFFALTGAGATADSYVIVDKVGDFGDDPGAGWAVAGASSVTKDHTLIRKSSITNGNPDWAASAGTDAESSEWVISDKPTAEYTPATLGSHTMTGPTVFVYFNVYAPDGPDTVWATGSFEGWSGYGVAMTDPDGNGIYNGALELSENFGDVEYKYTHGGWAVETGAGSGDWCDWNPNDTNNNFGFSVEEYDVYLPIFLWGQGCEQWHSDMSGRPWMIANEPGAIRVGPTMGSGEWWSNSEADLEARACYFDDRYFFHWNGDFHIEFGGNTWIEYWQGGDYNEDGTIDDQNGTDDHCGSPVAPHDNSNPASYSFDAEAGTITLHGAGAFLGLPKAINGGELSNTGTDVPGSVTYIIDHFDEDSAMVYIDISANEDGTSWWTYTMVREPEPTMVTFWLDAYDVPCDGSPYLAGSFNGWNATDIEMTYDEDYDEYYADVWLMPGYYEYKFACFDWAASENIPAECSDPNDDGYNNRYVEVPELDGDDWYEVDLVSWGECPDPDPCELVDCSNLHFAGVMESGLINYISGELGFTVDSVMSMIELGQVSMGVYSSWLDDDDDGIATYMPEFSEPEDSLFLFLVDYPYGIPDTTVYYFWWWAVDAYNLSGFEYGDLQEYGLGEECTFAYEDYDQENDTTYVYNARYWDPSLWEEELYMLAAGDDDVDPYDVWNVDLYGSCDFWFDGDDYDIDGVYLGNFQGHDYYQVNEYVSWSDANNSAYYAGGYLATITSHQENEFVRSSLEGLGVEDAHWFGLVDIMDDGTGWGWENGEPLGYTNWAGGEPNGPGEENCGEFYNNGEWNDTHCDGYLPFIVEFGEIQEPEEPVLTNYSLELKDLNSWNTGDTGTLPEMNIHDGLHLTVEFDMSGPGPYMGYAAIHFDSNFNGQLDSDDQNILSGPWYNSDHDYDDDVFVIQDNSSWDQNWDLGVFEADIYPYDDGNDYLRVQGATYFYSSIDTSYAIVETVPVTPYSMSSQRYQGQAVSAGDTTAAQAGLFFTVSEHNNYERFYGVTGSDGGFDIGVDLDSDTTSSHIYHSHQQRSNWDGRHAVLFWNDPYPDDETSNPHWRNYSYYPDGLPDGGVANVDVQVIEMNTIVSGYILDPDGNPVETWLNAYTRLGEEPNTFTVPSYSGTQDSSGYYSFWTINGSEVRIYSDYPGLEYYDSTIYVFSDLYDDQLDAYLFSYNVQLQPIDPGPPVNLIKNGGFEGYCCDDYGYNDDLMRHWDTFGDVGNYALDSTGSYVHNSDQTITAYEGDRVLKMWGGYHSDGFNATDIYQQHYDYVDPYMGGVITASAMMMSHPDDWIGDTTNGAATNRAHVFISYWDYDYNHIHTDWSGPFDGGHSPGEWHQLEVSGEVPDGAYSINIGVQFVQSDWSNGSVYFDDVQSSIGMTFVATGTIAGYVYGEMYDQEFDYWYMEEMANVPVDVYSENNWYQTHTDENGYYEIDVPANDEYIISGPSDLPGLYTSDMHYHWVDEGHHWCCLDLNYYAHANQWYSVEGHVVDADGNLMSGVRIEVSSADSNHSYLNVEHTDEEGFYHFEVPYGVYDIKATAPGHYPSWVNGVEVFDYTMVDDIVLEMVTEFDGSAQGVITFYGQEPPSGPAYVWLNSDNYSIGVNANEDGFYYVDLLDGIYGIGAGAPGYSWVYMEDAFEVSGNAVTYNMDLYEQGFAGPPEIVGLHDVPNDQGRQMRTVWQAGMPGDWGYFTQFSIWRKVNDAPIELWDYVETVPWHGEVDPYAAVVPTLGDSSMHEQHLSTFIVTAHTEDVNFWLDSEPVSGYSIDNLHPSVPMNFMFSQGDGAVSLSWSGPDEEDFSHYNVYRQEIVSTEPAVVFTTVDSFYVDQQVAESGAYEYWITAVDMSGLESDPSNSVSAVLSTDENLGLPTEFALKQNYPNPFNPSTQIRYALPEETMVTISIYDLMGRKVRTLVNDTQSAGYRTVLWNATNDMGRLVSAGVYIYSIQAGDFIQNRKMVLMK